MTFIHEPDHDHMEQALRDSQDLLTGIIASAMDAIITVDEDQNILLFNAAAEQMFGYPVASVLGKPMDILIPEKYRGRHRGHIRQFGETGITNRSMGKLGTIYGKRANGEVFQIEASISQVQTGRGKLYSVILRDITERVESEKKLVDSEQQLRAIFEQAAVGIAATTLNGDWVRVNLGMTKITGYSQAELLAMNVNDITYPEDISIEEALVDQLVGGMTQTYSFEKRYIRKDGQIIWIHPTVSLIYDMDGKPGYLVKVIEDITARKKVEAALQAKTDEIKMMTQQLWQTAKLATMGELAASVAHELNNPLAILSLRIESLSGVFPENNPERKELDIMEQEIDRMSSLVSNLLQFSRSGQRQISSLNIALEIDQTLDIIHNYLVHRHVSVKRAYDSELPLIQADRQQLRQLLLNLFTNACDAMPEGGLLTIAAHPFDNNRQVNIEIQDTGIGIEPNQIKRVIEPFFTTKPEGKGTGLGLAICRRIVEEHKGSLTITSPGKGLGTAVKITLPSQNGSKPQLIDE